MIGTTYKAMFLQKEIALLTTVLICMQAYPQNLIPNPDFEYYSLCPTNYSDDVYDAMAGVEDWSKPTLKGSCDYFNVCNTGNVGVPVNFFGAQSAYNGDAYAGIYAYNQGVSNYREYLQARLLDSLIKGITYIVSFRVCLGDQSGLSVSAKNIGAYLSTTPINRSDNQPFDCCKPQIVDISGSQLNDKSNWMLISDTFTASGGEKFITIGNFNNDAYTTYVGGQGGPQNRAYYYIDSVNMYPVDTLLNVFANPSEDTGSFISNSQSIEKELYIPNAFSNNGNGLNDHFYIRSLGIELFKLSIFDRSGKLIYQTNDINKAWDGKYRAKAVLPGSYHYFLEALFFDGEQLNEKGNVMIVR